MSNRKLNDLLRSFNANQISEINNFLNSAKGRQLKNRLSSADKAALLDKFSHLNTNDAKRRIQSMSADEIINLIRKL